MRPRGSHGLAITVLLGAALATGLALVRSPQPGVLPARPKAVARLVPPSSTPPAVAPVVNLAVLPDDAVKMNAAIPFSKEPIPAARPFKPGLAGDDLARSTDCLAAAAYYEAATEGDDGMRAVTQVVINRLRHPAFPKTICGVVFQGSERSTGCQFTFTCDGSLARVPSERGWAKARKIAAEALKGSVYKPVGYATHYHTNWVVPYWSGELDKIAAVGTHLFFRWAGWWGTPGAFRGQYGGREPLVEKMAALSAAHDMALPTIDAVLKADGDASLALKVDATASKAARDVYTLGSAATAPVIVILSPFAQPESYPAMAAALCGQRTFCKLLAWRDARKAPGLPPIEATHLETMSFSFLRDRGGAFEKALWNCRDFPRTDPRECIKQPVPAAAPAATPTPALKADAERSAALFGTREAPPMMPAR